MELFYLNINDFNFKADTEHSLQHLAGRHILEYAAKNFYNIENTEIEIINKKPKFKYSDIQFSISHSKNIAAVCFDKSPVGFDIEQIKPRDYTAIAKRMKFNLENNSLEAFYTQWTLFEAKYKLQQEAKSVFSMKFLDTYIISFASCQQINIEQDLKIIKIGNKE